MLNSHHKQMMSRLTEKEIERRHSEAIATSSRIRLYDSDVRGLSCIIHPTGKISFVAQRRIGGRQGKQVRVVIGHAPDMTLEDARKQASFDLAKMRNGEDVSLRKKELLAKQQAIANANTLPELFGLYLASRQQDQLNSPRYWYQVRSGFDRHVLEHLGKKPLLVHVGKPEIRYLMSKLGPSQQHLVFTFLRPFFKWAIDSDYIQTSPLFNMTPPKRVADRDRVLSEKELAAVWRACTTLGYPFGHAIKLLLLLAQREDELASMRFEDIDFNKQQWVIPKEHTKTKNAHIVHLPQLTMDILQSIPQRADYVFFTRKCGSEKLRGFGRAKYVLDLLISNPGMELSYARELIEQPKAKFAPYITCKPWRIHDLRRSAATYMAQLKHNPVVIDKILNHKGLSRIAAIYNRFEYLEERKAALEAWAAHLAGLVA